jgi:hypothetical protein
MVPPQKRGLEAKIALRADSHARRSSLPIDKETTLVANQGALNVIQRIRDDLLERAQKKKNKNAYSDGIPYQHGCLLTEMDAIQFERSSASYFQREVGR